MRGHTWSYNFMFTVQTLFLDRPQQESNFAPEADPETRVPEPAPLVGPSEVILNSFHEADPVPEPDFDLDEEAV